MAITPGIVGNYLANSLRRDARIELNKRPHFVPVNIDALEVTLKHILAQTLKDVEDPSIPKEERELYKQVNLEKIISISEFRKRIVTYVEKAHKNKINLNDQAAVGRALTNVDKLPPSTIYLNGEIVGVLYGSYEKASRGLFTNFLNKELSKFIKESIYKADRAKNYVRRFNVGHIVDVTESMQAAAAGESDTNLAVSPALDKLIDSLKRVDRLIEGNISDVPNLTAGIIGTNTAALQQIRQTIVSKLNDLGKRSHYGPRVKATLSKEVTQFLQVNGAITVVIQDEFENQYTYGTLLEGPTIDELAKLFINTSFSKTIFEEIETRLVEITKTGKFLPGTGVKKKPLKEIALPVKVKSSASSTKIKNVSVNITAGIKPTRRVNTLTTLQSLLNSMLAETIKQNMGNGTRSDILNLRSGRFASSVTIERMSQSREGMITAFYTYMKYPYQTFEPGYRQGKPETRNPKLLISKSIREIAAEKVANKLRAVSL